MSDRYKILCQSEITATGTTTLYTVPAPASTSYGPVEVSPRAVSQNTQTLLTTIVFSFLESASSNYVIGDLQLSDSGATAVDLLHELTFYPKQNSVIDINMTLPPSSSLIFDSRVYIGGTLFITAFGIELSDGYGPS
jgi:hypothetical protein